MPGAALVNIDHPESASPYEARTPLREARPCTLTQLLTERTLARLSIVTAGILRATRFNGLRRTHLWFA